MRQNIIQITCDSCENGIDIYPQMPAWILKDMLECNDVIIDGKKHFCNRDCYSSFLKKASKGGSD